MRLRGAIHQLSISTCVDQFAMGRAGTATKLLGSRVAYETSCGLLQPFGLTICGTRQPSELLFVFTGSRPIEL